MADDPILPKPSELVAPGIDALVALRPAALAHINDGAGHYAQVFGTLKAQANVALAYLADEVKQARIPFATGRGLTDLIRSEFNLTDAFGPEAAVGEVQLTRVNTSLAGAIPKGTRFVRRANPRALPVPLQGAEYVSTETTTFNTGRENGPVKVVATRPGPHANTLVLSDNLNGAPNDIEIEQPTALFDTFTTNYGEAAGGTNGVSEDTVRRIALAQAKGQYGPTRLGILVGAFRAGAHRCIVTDDPTNATTYVLVADESWAVSTRFVDTIGQRLRDEFSGFGAGKIQMIGALNKFIRVSCTVQLRSASYLNYTGDITAAITAASREYFDERPDWNTFKLSSLRGVISRSDRRILTCTSVSIVDSGGVAVPQPIYATTNSTHLYLVDDHVDATYSAPV